MIDPKNYIKSKMEFPYYITLKNDELDFETEAEVLTETDKALKISHDFGTWLPKSELFEYDTHSYEIPEWLLKKVGLI